MTNDIARNCSAVVGKFGLAGFAFFFVKGMLWLIAPFVIGWLF